MRGVDDLYLWSPFWVDRWCNNLSGPVGRRLGLFDHECALHAMKFAAVEGRIATVAVHLCRGAARFAVFASVRVWGTS